MGIFDLSTQQKSYNIENKDNILKLLKEDYTKFSQDSSFEKNHFKFKKFRPKNTYLPFDLDVEVKQTNEFFTLNFQGELQNVWLLVILIVLSILLTYGLGVIVIVLFVFLQKKVATKYIENSFEKFKKKYSVE